MNLYLFTYTRICIIYIHMHACMLVCMYMYLYIFMYVSTYVCMHSCLHVCMFVTMYINLREGEGGGTNCDDTTCQEIFRTEYEFSFPKS